MEGGAVQRTTESGATEVLYLAVLKPRAMMKRLKLKTLTQIFCVDGGYFRDGQFVPLSRTQRLCGDDGGSQGWRQFCPVPVPAHEH